MNTNLDRGIADDERIVEAFFHTFSDRSPHTLRNYRAAIRRFREYLGNKTLRDAEWEDVDQFKHALLHGDSARGIRVQAAATAAIQMAAIRSLYRWGSDPNIGLLPGNPTTCVRMPKIHVDRPSRFLTKSELGDLLDALRRQGDRNYLMGMMLVLLGLRVSEMTQVQWGDFYWDIMGSTVWLKIKKGKGGKSRDIKIPRSLWTCIQTYKKQVFRLPQDSFRLFPVTSRQVERIIRKAGIQGNINKKVTPHWLRHTNATMALLNGASLQQVQHSLGHSEITTTQRYLHTVEQLQKAPSDYVEDGIFDLFDRDLVGSK